MNDVQFEKVDLDLVNITDEMRRHIVEGYDDDRSAYLYKVCYALVGAGLTRDEILSVLTDPDNELAKASYEHAGNTTSRKAAAAWVWNYTLQKVMNEKTLSQKFLLDAEITEVVDDGTEVDVDGALSDWTMRFDMNKNGPRSTFKNACLILQNHEQDKILFARNGFSGDDVYFSNTPWGGEESEKITDDDMIKIKDFCVRKYAVEFPVKTLSEAITSTSLKHWFHPVREYLDGLEWDGVERLSSWLHVYAGATGPKEYIEAVATKFICAMVARIYNPGCKFDHVLILEGKQGVGKSTLAKTLASEAWFTDAYIDMKNKDSQMLIKSKWVVELGELSIIGKVGTEELKQFICQQIDEFRAPYGYRVNEYPRQCVFVGTTNQEDYLKDTTGNRRFWPVKTSGNIKLDELEAIRGQLFAEAKCALDFGEKLFLEGIALTQAETEQKTRIEVDELETVILNEMEKGLAKEDNFTLAELGRVLNIKMDLVNQRRMGKVLRGMGYERYTGKAGKKWRKK